MHEGICDQCLEVVLVGRACDGERVVLDFTPEARGVVETTSEGRRIHIVSTFPLHKCEPVSATAPVVETGAVT